MLQPSAMQIVKQYLHPWARDRKQVRTGARLKDMSYSATNSMDDVWFTSASLYSCGLGMRKDIPCLELKVHTILPIHSSQQGSLSSDLFPLGENREWLDIFNRCFFRQLVTSILKFQNLSSKLV